MKKSIILSTVLSFILVFGANAQKPNAQCNKGGKAQCKEVKGDYHQKMMGNLDLSEDQKTKVEGIHKKTMKEGMTINNKLGEKEARMKTLSSADSPDKKAITSLANEIGDLRTEMFVNRTMAHLEMRALLNEDQKLKFDMMKGHRKGPKMMGRQ
jgi:Spy/CpxP family protein refolding chaperone